jgi:sugar/nucleoside kinase (ribokinase family)
MADVVVLGQVGRDLVLRTPALPAAGRSATVAERRELLGGKGANQAAGLTARHAGGRPRLHPGALAVAIREGRTG